MLICLLLLLFVDNDLIMNLNFNIQLTLIKDIEVCHSC